MVNATEEMLEEAKRKYPIGTKFVSWDDLDDEKIRTIIPYDKNSTVTFNINHHEPETIRVQNGCGGKGCSNPSIYKNGVWAEIICSTVIHELW